MQEIGSLVRQIRHQAGLTQRDVAMRAGTSQPAVAAYEADRQTPTLGTLERLLAACGHELVVETRPASSPPTAELLSRNRRRILRLARACGITNVRVFGSVARGDAGSESDVDLLVDLEPERTLLDVVAFSENLAGMLGVKVDAATPDMLKSRVRRAALADARPL